MFCAEPQALTFETNVLETTKCCTARALFKIKFTDTVQMNQSNINHTFNSFSLFYNA